MLNLRTPLARWAAATASGTYVLIVLGAVVRATGSGLGCPDWPTCHGSWIPPWERKALIEYSHRSLAVLVGLAVAVVFWQAWRRRRDERRLVGIAAVAGILLLVQAALGRQVVLDELDAGLVTIHFTTAMLLLAALLILALSPDGLVPVDAAARRLWLVAGGVLVVVAGGAFVRGENAGLAFPDWPLMDGALVPTTLGDSLPDFAHFLHRLSALAVGVLIVAVVLGMRRAGRRPGAVHMRWLLVAGYLLQAIVGAAAVWLQLTAWTRIGHVAVAALTWGVAVVLPFLDTAGKGVQWAALAATRED